MLTRLASRPSRGSWPRVAFRSAKVRSAERRNHVMNRHARTQAAGQVGDMLVHDLAVNRDLEHDARKRLIGALIHDSEKNRPDFAPSLGIRLPIGLRRRAGLLRSHRRGRILDAAPGHGKSDSSERADRKGAEQHQFELRHEHRLQSVRCQSRCRSRGRAPNCPGNRRLHERNRQWISPLAQDERALA